MSVGPGVIIDYMMELESVKILKQRGVEYRLIELEEKAISVEDVIRYSKTEIKPEEICKTIILKNRKGMKYAIFMLGSMRIDFNKAKRIIGGKVSVASFDEVIDATGVEPGAVCPLTLKIPIFIDRGVLSRERINFGAGNHLYGLEIKTLDLSKIIDYQLVDVAVQ
jgi:prolyl-tRNA editing enzyme YbaK/EbsC (Cys-tRNA(Pro) deacylase)